MKIDTRKENSSMNILFFLVHPAHYHLFRNIINKLKEDNHQVQILIVKKDILEDLVVDEGWEYKNIMPEGRRNKKLPALLVAALNVLKADLRLFRVVKKDKADILIGTEATLAHIGKIFNIPSLLVNEDDTSATPENYLFYPFATNIILPGCCDVGKWKKKKITYNGYHELAYLHPKYFTPDREVIETFNPKGERYFILRLVELSASHDIGKSGITKDIAGNIIAILKKHGKNFITSERELEQEFEKYRLHINPNSMFHALFFADMYIGDSQTLAAEAAVLGTPSIRFSDFVGKLSYLEELEHKYHLTYGIGTSEPQVLYDKIEELLKTPNLKGEWQKKRQNLLKDKIDVTAFMVWLIENYPESVRELKNPKVQERFK